MQLPLLKLTIRLLVLMIFFVMIFLISTVLYSTKYWPDIYNYINANITIKRIPTLSELNLTILEVEVDVTTEYTTDDITDASTVYVIDFNIEEFTKIDQLKKSKRDIVIESFNNDYNELPPRGVVVDYMFEEGATTVDEPIFVKKIVKDLIDESKLVPKNIGDVEMVDRVKRKRPEKMILSCHGGRAGIAQIFPWIATVFIKNDSTNNQYEYYCDAAVINENILVTSARCVLTAASPVDPDNVLVFLGKRSLQTMSPNEKIVKINRIQLHENFTTEGGIKNDLALLFIDEPVTFNEDISAACLFTDVNDTDVERSATTAWDQFGDMVPVFFLREEPSCADGDDRICDSYGLEVPLCPSYGGIYVSRLSNGWYLRGIRSADPSNRGLCFTKDVEYTPLEPFGDWLAQVYDNKV